MTFFRTLAFTAAATVVMATSAGAATFGLDTTNGTAEALDGSYGLPVPTLPYAIFDFQDDGAGFGGLTLTQNTMITATYVGSEAGATNGATLALGGFSFSNATSDVGDQVTFLNTGNYVDLFFSTNNLGGFDTINNDSGGATDDRLHMAFTDIRNAAGDVTSVYAFFGDGAGDQDYDDMVIRLDIAQVPVPAAGLLLLSGLVGFGALSRRRSQRKS